MSVIFRIRAHHLRRLVCSQLDFHMTQMGTCIKSFYALPLWGHRWRKCNGYTYARKI